jgi:hypothetical protein
MPGQMLLNEALMSSMNIMLAYEAQKFYNRFQSYQMMLYSYIMGPTQKINGAFLRYRQNNEMAITQLVTDTGPLIVNASTNFYNAYNRSWSAAIKNQTLITRHQNCAKGFIADFNLYVKQFLQDYPQFFSQNLNFARVDDLMVDIFTSWSELYSGIAGCFSLAKNRYPPSPSPAPPKMADRYLDGDALTIQCLEQVHEIKPTFAQ